MPTVKFRFRNKKKIVAAIGIFAVLLLVTVKFDIEGDLEGIYLLKGSGFRLLEIKDDVLLGEYDQVIFKKDLPALHELLYHDQDTNRAEPYIKSAWNKGYGHGYIQNFSPDGSRFIICMSRFHDSQGETPKGLFIGGGLPQSRYENGSVLMNETGVAYFNGSRWYHIWCNANEAIAGQNSPTNLLFPSKWEFLGSRVHYATARKIMLQSSHRVMLDGVPAQVDRFLIYRAGDQYFLLFNRVRNVGDKPTGYYFVYGDEPWVGDYGTSMGNVGWTKDRLYYYESIIDPYRNTFAGMYDVGNPVILGERSNFSEMANFLEWLGDTRPNLVYFSNKEGKISDESARIPLSSRDNRVIFLQWGPRRLLPNQSETIALAIGMATTNPVSRLPIKPTVVVDWPDVNYILTAQ